MEEEAKEMYRRRLEAKGVRMLLQVGLSRRAKRIEAVQEREAEKTRRLWERVARIASHWRHWTRKRRMEKASLRRLQDPWGLSSLPIEHSLQTYRPPRPSLTETFSSSQRQTPSLQTFSPVIQEKDSNLEILQIERQLRQYAFQRKRMKENKLKLVELEQQRGFYQTQLDTSSEVVPILHKINNQIETISHQLKEYTSQRHSRKQDVLRLQRQIEELKQFQ